MSITDELRAWAKEHLSRSSILAIADRIDAEHQKAEDEWKAKNGDTWLKGYAACHEELMEGHPVIAADLEKDGWVKLPVDADGEPIHIGDVMDNIVCPSVHREVTGVGVECFYGWDNCSGRYSQFDVNRYRHHHEPTVEDVLTKFGIDWEYEDNCDDRAALLAEYAAKLRLAEVVDA